jgi:hypothetical protein
VQDPTCAARILPGLTLVTKETESASTVKVTTLFRMLVTGSLKYKVPIF